MYVQTNERRINTDKENYDGIVTGLVDCNGTLYPCPDYGYDRLARELGHSLDILLNDAGWVHVGYAAGVYTGSKRHITQDQVNTLWDIRSISQSGLLQEEIDSFIARRQQ